MRGGSKPRHSKEPQRFTESHEYFHVKGVKMIKRVYKPITIIVAKLALKFAKPSP